MKLNMGLHVTVVDQIVGKMIEKSGKMIEKPGKMIGKPRKMTGKSRNLKDRLKAMLDQSVWLGSNRNILQ